MHSPEGPLSVIVLSQRVGQLVVRMLDRHQEMDQLPSLCRLIPTLWLMLQINRCAWVRADVMGSIVETLL